MAAKNQSKILEKNSNIVSDKNVLEIHPPLKIHEYQHEVPRVDIPVAKIDNATEIRLRLKRKKRIKRCLYRFDERMGKQVY